MIRRNTWIALALFVAALAAAVWWTQREPTADQLESTPTLQAVWSVMPNEILAVEVTGPDGQVQVRAVRAEDVGWVLETPADSLASAGRIEQAVTSLLSLTPTAVFSDVTLADYGLSEPEMAIRLEMATGQVNELLLGRTAPTGSVVYARTPQSDDVLLLSEFLFSDIRRWPEQPPLATPTVPATESGTPES